MKNQLLKKLGGIMVPVMVGVITIGTLAFADETNVSASIIKSEGNIDFANGEVVFKAEDLTNLEKEINTLESEYKQYTLNGLNSIGTYFDSNGEPYYAKVTDRETAKSTQPVATGLSFAQLQKGIDNSQYVADEGEQATLDGNLLFYKDETAYNNKDLTNVTTDTDTGLPVLMAPAKAENLTAGTAAYVNGELLIGTGSDNKSYYNLGYADGYAQKLDNVSVEYNYHEHTGNDSQIGGCYDYVPCICGATAVEIEHIYEACNNPVHGSGHQHRKSTMHCNTCGWTSGVYAIELDASHQSQSCIISCPNTVYNRKIGLICGKTEGVSIDSATLIFP